MIVVCLGCGRPRTSASAVEFSPADCPFCGDVSWTYLDDAERDPAGVAGCIERRRRAREGFVSIDVDGLLADLLERTHTAA